MSDDSSDGALSATAGTAWPDGRRNSIDRDHTHRQILNIEVLLTRIHIIDAVIDIVEDTVTIRINRELDV